MTLRSFYTMDCPDIDRFRVETDRELPALAVPSAASVEKNIPIYDGAEMRARLSDPHGRQAVLSEWSHVLGALSGVLVIRGVFPDTKVIDDATGIFDRIIADEASGTGGGGDHFAKSGANARIWNALQKLALADPEVFALYHARPEIDAVAEAWLGPGYQISAQVNVVRPGGAAQTAHRDYHLGFMSAEEMVGYPARVHHVSPALTLQGGIAHVDAPVEAGPTKLLPFSQTYGPGYLAYHQDAFREHFEACAVQLPLAKGDTLFFNPALFHAAGDNRSAGINRMVNLLQISSAFGRAMESIDRTAMSQAVYPALQRHLGSGRVTEAGADATIAATAEGYAFPTNLDRDAPVGGLAPETQAALFRRALSEGMAAAEFSSAIRDHAARHHP